MNAKHHVEAEGAKSPRPGARLEQHGGWCLAWRRSWAAGRRGGAQSADGGGGGVSPQRDLRCPPPSQYAAVAPLSRPVLWSSHGSSIRSTDVRAPLLTRLLCMSNAVCAATYPSGALPQPAKR